MYDKLWWFHWLILAPAALANCSAVNEKETGSHPLATTYEVPSTNLLCQLISIRKSTLLVKRRRCKNGTDQFNKLPCLSEMRLVESFLICTLGFFLFTKDISSKWMCYFIISSGIGIHFILESFRWQMVPAYIVSSKKLRYEFMCSDFSFGSCFSSVRLLPFDLCSHDTVTLVVFLFNISTSPPSSRITYIQQSRFNYCACVLSSSYSTGKLQHASVDTTKKHTSLQNLVSSNS